MSANGLHTQFSDVLGSVISAIERPIFDARRVPYLLALTDFQIMNLVFDMLLEVVATIESLLSPSHNSRPRFLNALRLPHLLIVRT